MRIRLATALPIAGAMLALVVSVVTIHPFETAPLSFDTGSTVAYFDRIVAGRHLEAFVTTTPKPLLTAVYGSLHALVADWRAISWLLIGVFAAAVAAATALAYRTSGATAAVFAGVVLAGAPALVWDVSLGGGVPWAALLLAGAGLAMTGSRRRPAAAGTLLMLAALARIEALVVVGGALAVLAVLEVGGRLGSPGPLGRAGRPDPADWLLAIGLLAFPLMLLHDWLLTGNPFYWAVPSADFSAKAPAAVMSPSQVVGFLIGRYRAVWPLTLLALVGGIDVLLRRRWVVAAGLAALGPGVAAFLVVLAWRGTYVSDRYAELIDVGLGFTAAVGFAALVTIAVRLLRVPGGGEPAASLAPSVAEWRSASPARGSRAIAVASAALAIGVAVVGSRGWGPWDATLRSDIAAETALNRHVDEALPRLAAATAPLVSAAERALPGDYRPDAHLPGPRLVVPVLARPRIAVDLRLPLWAVSSASPLAADPAASRIAGPMVVFHDRGADRPAARYAPFEIGAPARVGDVELAPLLSDPAEGLWILRLDPAPG